MGFTKNFSAFMRLSLCAASALTTSGCEYLVQKASDATMASYGASQTNHEVAACGATGNSIFKASVYPYLKTNCSGCHNSTTPAFAVASQDTSYTIAKDFLNQATPASSIIYMRAIDGHCGTAECKKSGADFMPGVKAWAAAELNPPAPCASSGDPNGVPNSGVLLRVGGTTIQQMLSAAQPANFCAQYEAVFVQNSMPVLPTQNFIVRFAGASVYSDSACRTAVTSVSFSANPYRFFYVMEPAPGDRVLGGTIDGYSVGFTAHISILPAATPSPVPTPSVTPSPKPSASPTPVPSPAPTPCVLLQRQNAYSATVWPLAKTNCAGCHASGGRPQFANATLATAYSVALGLVSVNAPTASKLYTKAKDGHCGACNATMGANFLAQLNLWLPAETTNNCSALTTPH